MLTTDWEETGWRGERVNTLILVWSLTGTDDIWEFRTLYNRQYIRLFAFWDKRDKQQTLIICTHGLLKTTPKTPKDEIVHAERVKALYFKK